MQLAKRASHPSGARSLNSTLSREAREHGETLDESAGNLAASMNAHIDKATFSLYFEDIIQLL